MTERSFTFKVMTFSGRRLRCIYLTYNLPNKRVLYKYQVVTFCFSVQGKTSDADTTFSITTKMAVNFTGNWQHVESENFEGYLDAMGVNFAMKKIAKSISPKLEIQQDGDSFQIKTIGAKTRELKFKIGEEFEDEMPAGKVKVIASWDGSKLHSAIESPKGKMTAEREIRADGRLYQVMTAPDGTKCTRIFAKQ